MYQYAMEIKLLRLEAPLQNLLERAEFLRDFPCSVECVDSFSPYSMRNADLVICEEGEEDLERVRQSCRPGAILVCCVRHAASEAVRESIAAAADEVWWMPFSPANLLRRLEDILTRLEERKQLHYTRLCMDVLMDSSPDLIWCKDTRGSHLKVNAAFCKAVGKTKEQVHGRGHYYIWDIPPEEYAESEYVCLETEEVVLAKRELCLFDEEVLCKNGLRQFKTYKAPVIDVDGTLLGTVGVAQDVTTLSRTTHLLSRSIADAQTTINIAHLHYWKYNPQTQTAHLGALYAKELGLPRRLENYPQCLIDRGIIRDESAEACLSAHKRLLLDQQDMSYDVRLVFPDGREVWWRVKYTPPENGETDWFGMSENIDDYKRIERCFTVSAMQNGITSWVYDISNNTLYSITNTLDDLGLTGPLLENVPYCFAQNPALHREDVRHILDLHGKIKKGDETASMVTRWRSKVDSEWHWYRLSYTTIFDSAGRPQRAIGSAFNITDQVKAQHQYTAELAWRELQIRDALCALQLNLTQNRVNEVHGGYGRAGGSVDGLLGDLMGRVPLDAWDAVTDFYDREELLRAFSEGQGTRTVEHLFNGKEDCIWVKATVNIIKNPGTSDVEAFLSLEDVDEKKLAEISYSAASLREHDALACVRSVAGTIRLIYDRNNVVVPTRGKEMPFAEYLSATYLLQVPEEDRYSFVEALSLETITLMVEERGIYSTHFRQHGKTNGMRQKRVQFFNIDRVRQLMCMVVSDITDAFEVEQRRNAFLQKALEAARHSSQAKTAFLANMSHEIRTPIGAIIGMSEILLGKEPSPEVIEGITIIRNAGTGLLGIINDILDLSKVESGKVEVADSPYQVASLLQDACSMVQLRMAEKNLCFLVNIAPSIPAGLRGDETRIRQILTNILGNAMKYTREGSVVLDVDGEFLDSNRYLLRISVTDTGIGIKQEDMPRLFEIFSRVDSQKNRNITGTGLGLALSRTMANLMGGEITLKSTYGVGSTFIINLPQGVINSEPVAQVQQDDHKVLVYEPDQGLSAFIVRTLDRLGVPSELCAVADDFPVHTQCTHLMLRRRFWGAAAVHAAQYPPDRVLLLMECHESSDAEFLRYRQMYLALLCLHSAEAFNGSPMAAQPVSANRQQEPLPWVRVLIVDDNPTNLLVATGLMAPYRMDVETASSGQEALDLLKHNRYDIIFMDHMMPEMDGVETTAHIRAMPDEYFRTVPIIALTANAIFGARERFLEQGMTEFLAKPIELSKLHRVLKTYAPPAPDDAPLAETLPSMTNILGAPDDSDSVGESMDSASATHLPGAIDGVDADKALRLFGSVSLYHSILQAYGADLQRYATELQQFEAAGDMENFAIAVHAVKSASRSVGADALGELAEELEDLSLKGQTPEVRQRFAPFMECFMQVFEGVDAYIRTWITPEIPAASTMDEPAAGGKPLNAAFVRHLRRTCRDMDYDLVEKALDELDLSSCSTEAQETVARMKSRCASFDYAALDDLIERLAGG